MCETSGHGRRWSGSAGSSKAFCGRIDWPWALGLLKKAGYDGTITLEVFTPDREYLRYSRDALRRIWDSA